MGLIPSQIWFAIAIGFIILEVMVPLPTLMVAGALGLAALVVALLAFLIPIVPIQIILWVLLSIGTILYSRRLIPKDSHRLMDDIEGITLTEIPAGEYGRVEYEGGSWRAKCEDRNLAIAAHQKVIIVSRQGTTLIVAPEHWLDRHN